MTRDTSTLSEQNPYKGDETINDAARTTAALLSQQANYIGGLSEISTVTDNSKQDSIYGQLTGGNNQIVTWFQAWLAIPDGG